MTPKLTQRTGGAAGEVPLWIEQENAEKAARLIRTAARELVELKIPLRTLWVLWQETVAEGGTVARLQAIGRAIRRLVTRGLGEDARVLLEQMSTLTFVGDQAVFRFDGLQHPAAKTTTPRAQNSQGRETT